MDRYEENEKELKSTLGSIVGSEREITVRGPE
jgi:hypothetical protein